jgi:hypothetical protein
MKRFFGENQIVIDTEERAPLNLKIGDYVVYKGLKYYLNTLPAVTKVSGRTFRYSIVFEAEYYNLTKVQFLESGEPDFNYVGSAEDMLDLIITNLDRVYPGEWTKGTVSITNTGDKLMNFSGEHCRGVLKRMCDEFDCEVSFSKKVISLYDRIENATSLALEYHTGLHGFTRTTESDKNIVTRLYPLGSEKNLSADYGSPRLKPALSKNLLSNPGFETGSFTGWTLWGSPGVRTVQSSYPTYEGSYSYRHKCVDQNGGSSQTITVQPNTEYTLSAWVYSTPDITNTRIMAYSDSTYYSAYVWRGFIWDRIHVTFTTGAAETSIQIYVGGKGECWFDAIQLERSDQPSPYSLDTGIEYLERNVDLYGIIEKTVIFDDVCPNRTGTISYVDGSDVRIFRDSGMDFDLNSYLLDGVTAKVNFLTGSLAGYTFDVETYTAGTKQYKLINQTFQSGLVLPSATEKPAVNDTYVLLDIKLPDSYIDTAEEELLQRGLRYIEENAEPRVTYELDTDPQYFKHNYITPAIGDKITVTDTDLDISTVVRVTEIKQYLIDQYRCELVLTNHPEASTAQALYDSGAETKKKIDQSKISDLTKAINNWRTSEELHHIIVDANGYIRVALLTADNIQAGAIVSSNGNTYFDLDNNTLVIGSGEVSIAGTVINSIEDGADVTENNTAADTAKVQGYTIIQGGYIKTNYLTADNIQTGTLTGRTVQTASSNKRVVIDGTANTMTFYDSSNRIRVLVDDNATYGQVGVYGEQYSATGKDFTAIFGGKILMDAALSTDILFDGRIGNPSLTKILIYGSGDIDTAGFLDAATGFKNNGTPGLSQTLTLASITSITVSGGIITAAS